MNAPEPPDELDLLLGRMRAAAAPLREVLRDLHERNTIECAGKVATYIPELARADPGWFGIALVTVDGQVFEVGDSGQPFTIQSISKPLVFGQAIEDNGLEAVLARVGVEPTGEAFNAIVLDEASNRPYNPMVNAGAIATTDLIKGRDYPDRVSRMLEMLSGYCGRPIHVDQSVFLSERQTGHRNRAMVHLMLNFGMVGERFEDSLELYFQQCAAVVTCRDLAVAGATLARGGVNPLTGRRVIAHEHTKYVLSIMHSCGLYDFAGEWAFRIGIPAKSGVGGGIMGVVPGRFGIATFSPLLDPRGNSTRGIRVFQELSERFGLHCFETGFEGASLASLVSPARPGRGVQPSGDGS